MIYTLNRLTEPRLDQKEFAYLVGGLRGGIFPSQIKSKAQTNLSLKEQSRNLRLSQLKARKAQNTQPPQSGQNRSWLSRFGFGNKKAQGNQLTNQKSGGGLWSRLKGLVGGGQKPSINKTNYKNPKSQIGMGNNSSGKSVPSSVMSIPNSAGNNNYFLNSNPNLPNNNKFPSSATKIQSNIKAVPKPSIMKKGEGTPNNIGNSIKGNEFRVRGPVLESKPVQKTPPTPTPTQRIEGGWKSNANYFYNNNKFPQPSPNKVPPIQAQWKIPTPSNEVRVNTTTNIPTRDQSRRSVMARQQTPTNTSNTSGSVMSQQPQYNYNYVSGSNSNTNTMVLNTSGSSSSGATYKVPRVESNPIQPSGASAGKQNPQGQGQQGGGKGKGKQNPQGQGQQSPPQSQQNPGSGNNNNNSGSGNNQNQQQAQSTNEESQGMSTTEKLLLGGGLATTGYGLYAMSGGGKKKKQEE